MMDGPKINIMAVGKNIISASRIKAIFIVLLVATIAIVAAVGIAGFMAMKIRIAQQIELQSAPSQASAPLTDEQKKELLEKLSALVAGSAAAIMTDTQKQQLLRQLSMPTLDSKQLTDEEKLKLLESLSAPGKQ